MVEPREHGSGEWEARILMVDILIEDELERERESEIAQDQSDGQADRNNHKRSMPAQVGVQEARQHGPAVPRSIHPPISTSIAPSSPPRTLFSRFGRRLAILSINAAE